jgi:hypothetical protein
MSYVYRGASFHDVLTVVDQIENLFVDRARNLFNFLEYLFRHRHLDILRDTVDEGRPDLGPLLGEGIPGVKPAEHRPIECVKLEAVDVEAWVGVELVDPVLMLKEPLDDLFFGEALEAAVLLREISVPNSLGVEVRASRL